MSFSLTLLLGASFSLGGFAEQDFSPEEAIAALIVEEASVRERAITQLHKTLPASAVPDLLAACENQPPQAFLALRDMLSQDGAHFAGLCLSLSDSREDVRERALSVVSVLMGRLQERRGHDGLESGSSRRHRRVTRPGTVVSFDGGREASLSLHALIHGLQSQGATDRPIVIDPAIGERAFRAKFPNLDERPGDTALDDFLDALGLRRWRLPSMHWITDSSIEDLDDDEPEPRLDREREVMVVAARSLAPSRPAEERLLAMEALARYAIPGCAADLVHALESHSSSTDWRMALCLQLVMGDGVAPSKQAATHALSHALETTESVSRRLALEGLASLPGSAVRDAVEKRFTGDERPTDTQIAVVAIAARKSSLAPLASRVLDWAKSRPVELEWAFLEVVKSVLGLAPQEIGTLQAWIPRVVRAPWSDADRRALVALWPDESLNALGHAASEASAILLEIEVAQRLEDAGRLLRLTKEGELETRLAAARTLGVIRSAESEVQSFVDILADASQSLDARAVALRAWIGPRWRQPVGERDLPDGGEEVLGSLVKEIPSSTELDRLYMDASCGGTIDALLKALKEHDSEREPARVLKAIERVGYRLSCLEASGVLGSLTYHLRKIGSKRPWKEAGERVIERLFIYSTLEDPRRFVVVLDELDTFLP